MIAFQPDRLPMALLPREAMDMRRGKARNYPEKVFRRLATERTISGLFDRSRLLCAPWHVRRLSIGRVIAQLLGIVGVCLARLTAEHRLPEQGGSAIVVDSGADDNFGSWEV